MFTFYYVGIFFFVCETNQWSDIGVILYYLFRENQKVNGASSTILSSC